MNTAQAEWMSDMVATVRVLPPDVYDTIEFSALAFMGIGRGSLWDRDGAAPCCAIGHAAFTQDIADNGACVGPVVNALWSVGITGVTNDAVFANDEHWISFPEWCRRLNVVRGAA